VSVVAEPASIRSITLAHDEVGRFLALQAARPRLEADVEADIVVVRGHLARRHMADR
jgi:hypothetical protein